MIIRRSEDEAPCIDAVTTFVPAVTRVLSCAECRAPMQTREIDGVVVDECPSCSLRWLDDGELDVLLAVRTSWSVEALGPARSPCESSSWCAVCHHSTVSIRFHAVPHVHIDACVEHGHWLRDWQGRELMLWGRKEATLAAAVRTRPYARRFDRLRSTTIVWLVSTALACRGLSSHSVVSIVIAVMWAFDLAETIVASYWRWHGSRKRGARLTAL